MDDLTFKARLARIEYLADQAKIYADRAYSEEGATYWEGIESAYRIAIQIFDGNDPYC